MQAGLSTKNAPSPSVVLPHYAFGAIAFVVASLMMFFGADNIVVSEYGPKVLGLIHVLILAWVTVIIYGALYQLIPVVMEVKLFNENLAYISFGSIVTGVGLMSYSFWFNYIAPTIFIHIGGSLIILSVLLFVVNAIGSALKSKNKTIENRFIISSVVWLLITVLYGFFIILNISYHWVDKSNIELLKIHLAFGLIGWFLQLIIGVGSTLLPMFFISHKLNKKYIETAYYLINAGLVLLSISLYYNLNRSLSAIFGLAVFAGVSLFVKYNYDAYKKRLRRKLDIGMKLTVYSFPFLFISLLSGVLLLFNVNFLNQIKTQLALIFGSSLVLGFFTGLILGQMYKTLPFIVWLQKYQDKVGKYKIPLPNDLYNEKIADYHFYSYLASIILLLIAEVVGLSILVKISSLLFFITSTLYLINTFKIILHKENIQELETNIKK